MWIDFANFAVNALNMDPTNFLEWTYLDFSPVKKSMIEYFTKKTEVDQENMKNIVTAFIKTIANMRGGL